jgi:hypothetical protein
MGELVAHAGVRLGHDHPSSSPGRASCIRVVADCLSAVNHRGIAGLPGHLRAGAPLHHPGWRRRQKSGKVVLGWAVEGDLDPSSAVSNTYELERPPHSGVVQTFPEIDRVEWFDLDEARRRLKAAQVPFLDRLQAALASPLTDPQRRMLTASPRSAGTVRPDRPASSCHPANDAWSGPRLRHGDCGAELRSLTQRLRARRSASFSQSLTADTTSRRAGIPSGKRVRRSASRSTPLPAPSTPATTARRRPRAVVFGLRVRLAVAALELPATPCVILR